MGWWGKVFGGTFGLFLGGPLGALVGAALGHNFDVGLKRVAEAPDALPSDRERIQTAFFSATFAVMGRLAKADGRVTEDEIRNANQVMDRMGLTLAQRRMAQRLFNQGKAPDFPLDPVLDQLRQVCRRRHSLLRMFLEIQLQTALADGAMNPSERALLEHVAMRLGFDRRELAALEEMARAEARFRQGPQHQIRRMSLADAYAVLGVDVDTDPVEIKKAYRRLMSQHHPDKLVSKGLPEEMIKVANEKTQEVKAAWEVVREARKL